MQRQFEEGTTLDRFIFETTKEHADATGQFATLLKQVALILRQNFVEATSLAPDPKHHTLKADP